MIGILANSLPTPVSDPFKAIEAVAALGLRGCLFNGLTTLSHDIDASALREVAAFARGERVSIGAAIGWLNPCRPTRSLELLRLGDGDLLAGLLRLVEAGAMIDVCEQFFVVGTIEDRFDRTTPWREQLVQVAALLRAAAPMLRDHGARLLVKTHEEITTFEILRLIEQVGADVLAVAFDPVNVLVRLEHPGTAFARIAPYVGQLHLDDALLRFDGETVRRVLCPLGAGVIDWPAIVAEAPNSTRWIEIHRGQFAMDVFDADWLAAQPDLSVAEFASVLRFSAVTRDAAPDPLEPRFPATLAASLALPGVTET